MEGLHPFVLSVAEWINKTNAITKLIDDDIEGEY